MSDINNEVALIQDISEIDHFVVNPKKKKKEIKALAQQMVDNGESIDPYNPDASRNNRRLNRFYKKVLIESQEGIAAVPQDLPLATRMNILQERDPARFRDYMQRLDKAAKEGDADSKQLLDEIFETGARDRRGYEGLNEFMMASTGGLPGLLGTYLPRAIGSIYNNHNMLDPTSPGIVTDNFRNTNPTASTIANVVAGTMIGGIFAKDMQFGKHGNNKTNYYNEKKLAQELAAKKADEAFKQ